MVAAVGKIARLAVRVRRIEPKLRYRRHQCRQGGIILRPDPQTNARSIRHIGSFPPCSLFSGATPDALLSFFVSAAIVLPLFG